MARPQPPDGPQPRWRVPVHPLPSAVAGRSAQILALTDVEAPRGKRCRVQIRPEPPGQREPLAMIGGVADLLLPALISGAVGAAARKLRLAVVRPGDRWTIEVIRHATRWRGERVIYDETIEHPAAVIDRAFELTELIQRGASPLTW